MPASFLEKQPAERFWIGADFSDELDPGENIVLSGSSVSEFNMSGTSNKILLDGTLTVDPSGKRLIARVAHGIDGEKIKLSFRAHTDADNIYEHDIIVSIVD